MFADDAEGLIEGVGNEVLFTVPVVAAVVFGLLCFAGFHEKGLGLGRDGKHVRHVDSHITADEANERWQQRRQLLSSPLPAASTRARLDNGAALPARGSMAAHYGSDAQCPICLGEPRHSVETNCGHLFCASCLVSYWHHGNWRGAVRCPVCRQQWLDHLRDLPTLLRHVGSEFFSMGGIMYMFRLRIVLCFVAAIMYLISPLDMIPEAIFGILGLLDDLFVVLLLAIYVTVIYRRFLATRWQEDTT
ncbi:E3 ubiquitin-protein ligase RNF170 isoform X6 [Rhipicephalus microplus]|uniref:E3 ubiquitin-protein ligase RNF170 isoform X6 n=1 Tax=Rhipicephalus microplus TaxID=6941 RepID=UPI003F6AF6B8